MERIEYPNPAPEMIGENSIAYRPVYIHPSAQIGENVKIGAFCDIGKGVKIGDNCNIQSHVTISNGCKIGDNVFIGPNTSLLNDRYMDGNINPVVIGHDVKIGGGVIILPGVVVEPMSKIGAGSVVTKDVFTGTTVYGNPAEVKK